MSKQTLIGISVVILTMIILLSIFGCAHAQEFTDLDEGTCSYWDQDLEESAYVTISCWEWLDIVLDSPNEQTECILRNCSSCSRHFPNVIKYEGKWIIGYGWSGPEYNEDMVKCREPVPKEQEKKKECNLPPKLQEAYNQLKELLKDTEGIDVKCI